MSAGVLQAFNAIKTLLSAQTFAGFVARVAFSTLLSTVTSKLFGLRRVAGTGISSMQVMTRGALEYRKVVYGEAMLSGVIVYTNLTGGVGEYLWYVLALTGHDSEDLISIWFDGDPIIKAEIDWAAGTGAADGTGTGDVSTAKWVGDNSTTGVQLFYYLGDAAQPVCGVLDTAFPDITTAHRLRGCTYLVATLYYQKDTENVWRKGAPNNVKAVIKGRKIYDSRLDTTNGGTGTHRYTDSTTWEWSDNPALCVADYLMTYMAVDPATSIDWPSVAAAADDCETTVTIPTASSEARFTCNGALSLGSTHKDNLDALLSSMDGKLAYTGGVWKVRASMWEASALTITADDLAGAVEVRGSAPRAERFNTIRGFFVDPLRKYESVEFPHVSSSSYITRDNGEVIEFDLQLPFTNTTTMAQRIAYRNLEQGDNQVIASLTMNARGAKIAVGDVVSVTLDDLSWSAKTFRVIEWSRRADGTYKVVLREDVAASYSDPVEGAYSLGANPAIAVPADFVPAPSGLTATSVPVGVQLAWTSPPVGTYDAIDIYEDTDDSWAGAVLVGSVGSGTDMVTIAHTSGTDYYYWIRARRAPSDVSDRFPDSDTTTITAAGSGGTGGNSVFYASIFQRAASAPSTPSVDDGSYDFATQTLTPAAGWSITPPASDGNPLYVSTGMFEALPTGTDNTVTWTAPAVLVSDGVDGGVGGDGNSVFYASIFQRAASAPSTPSVDDGSYNFATQTLTPAAGWSATPPASDGNPLYVSTGVFEAAIDGTDNTVTWTAPAELVSDGKSTRYPTVYKLNDSAMTDDTAGTYADPLSGLEAGWDYAVPALANDGDMIYAATRIFTADGAAPQQANWSTPAVYATRIDGSDGAPGTPGAAGQDIRTVNIYRKNSSTISSTSGTFADPLSGNTSWSYAVPALTTDGDEIFVAVRTFTDDAASPQDANWSTPAIYATRIDGTDGDPGTPGAAGQDIRTVNIYRKNSSSINSSSGTFADPLSGNTSWSYAVPAITADSDEIFVAVRTLTDDAASPQDATWSTPAIYAQRTDGTDAVDTRYPTIYRKNSSSISSTSGTFADPLSGNASWSYAVPALTTDGDIIYASARRFTSDGLSPQDANWSTPAIYARRVDGTDGTDAVDTRYPTIYRKNSSSISSTSGTFADPLSGNASWSYAVPALTTDGDIIYASARRFTSDGLSPQDANWSTPAIYARRVDGTDGGDGTDAQDVRTVNLYRKNSSTISSTSGTFADPRAGNTSWSYAVPALTADGDIVYVAVRTFTDDGLSPQDANWSTPAIYARRTDGTDGTDPVIGYLTNVAHVVNADNDGTNYVLTAAGGTHKMFQGTTDRTTSSTHSVLGGSGSPSTKTQNGLTMSINVSTGVYSLSGASWTTDAESFTLRGVYGGVTIDSVYTIVKAKSGGAGSSSNTDLIGGSFSISGTDPSTATVGYQLNTDGAEYKAENSGTPNYTFLNTWMLSGAVADYECYMQDLGTGNKTPTGAALDTWLSCSTVRSWYVQDTLASGAPATFNGTIKIRHAETLVQQGTASISFDADKA